jgi:hypothetical protein
MASVDHLFIHHELAPAILGMHHPLILLALHVALQLIKSHVFSKPNKNLDFKNIFAIA